jgi:hypothetical protein
MRTERIAVVVSITMANTRTYDDAATSPAQQSVDDGHSESVVSHATATLQGGEEEASSWNELLFGNLFSKPKPKRRIVKAIPPPPPSTSFSLSPLSSHADIPPNREDDKDDDALSEQEIDPLQLQKEQRRRSAQERQRKLHAQMLQEHRFSKKEPSDAPKVVANPMSRFLSVFSIHAHPEHKRRAVVTDDDTALLSPKRPRPMEETDGTETSTEQKDDRSLRKAGCWNGGTLIALGVIVATTAFFLLFHQCWWNSRQQTEL